jgi:hypothetical protein
MGDNAKAMCMDKCRGCIARVEMSGKGEVDDMPPLKVVGRVFLSVR